MRFESIVERFEVSRRLVTQGAVQTLAVVKDFHIVKQRVANLGGVLKLLAINQLQFERAPKGFHGCVIITITLAAHGGHQLCLLQCLAIFSTGGSLTELILEGLRRR